RVLTVNVDGLEHRSAGAGQIGDLAPGAGLDLAGRRRQDRELLGRGPAVGADVLGAEAGVRAQVRAGVELRLTVRGEVDVVADAEGVRPQDVRADSGLDRLAAPHRREGELV